VSLAAVDVAPVSKAVPIGAWVQHIGRQITVLSYTCFTFRPPHGEQWAPKGTRLPDPYVFAKH
jgi:hypothetical protein